MEPLDIIEIRVLGSLVEKEKATPDYYPLTMNALKAACNQKTSRNPVMELDEYTIASALDTLLKKQFIGIVSGMGSRVTKYQHNLERALDIDEDELVVLAILMLRGEETLGELRTHSGRMFEFDSIEDVEQTIQKLLDREIPLVIELPKLPGQKEIRYTHLLAGMPEIQEDAHQPAIPQAILSVRAEHDRIDALEEAIASLRSEFEAFKKQFE